MFSLLEFRRRNVPLVVPNVVKLDESEQYIKKRSVFINVQDWAAKNSFLNCNIVPFKPTKKGFLQKKKKKVLEQTCVKFHTHPVVAKLN